MKSRLSLMMFLHSFIWGGWFVTMGICLAANLSASGAQSEIERSDGNPHERRSPSGATSAQMPHDSAAIERGKQLFGVNCAFCHGSDARGGEVGPDLLHSPFVRSDRNGEVIAAVVLNGRIEKGMPRFNMPMQNIADISAFVHDISAKNPGLSRFDVKSVLVGTPSAGKGYFNGEGHCVACHSVTHDLAHIGAKFDPKTLQDRIFAGGGAGLLGAASADAPPQTVLITLQTGEMVKGRLISLDDFAVVLTDTEGSRRTIRREGDSPHIEVFNPLQAHRNMVRAWEDRDLHNVTAYLETLK